MLKKFKGVSMSLSVDEYCKPNFWLISSTIGLKRRARMNFIPINEDS